MAFFGAQGKSKCVIGEVQCDAEIRTSHGKTGTLTEHAVESGSPVTDHYRVDPDQVEIEGVISDSPLSDIPLPAAGTVGAIAGAIGNDQSPSQTARDALESYFDNAEIITITTRRKTYTNMVLTSFAYTDEVGTANVLRFTIRARKIRLVDTETGLAIEKPKAPTHAKKKSAGQAATSEASEKKRSVAAALLFGS